MAKIGILGATFDPIHNAHIEMARGALAEEKLDKVFFITGGNPPHKKNDVTPAELRHKMVCSAIENEPHFEAIDYEVKKESFSYTAETLAYLKNKYPENEYYFILGADSLDYIEKWYKPEKIFEASTLITFARKGFSPKEKAAELTKIYGAKIKVSEIEVMDISSTKIREYTDMGFDISEFVPESASDIINKEGLYRRELTELREKIKAEEKESRFLHTEGVCKMAVSLAEYYGADVKKAYIAALLHDCAKNVDDCYGLCEKYGVELDSTEKEVPALVHAKLGAYFAGKFYGIRDKDIVNAIKWHTLGRRDMSLLERIIFVSDMIEEGRKFPGVDKIRKAAFKNLDKAVYLCADSTIRFNRSKGNSVHKNAYMVREHFKEKAKNNL